MGTGGEDAQAGTGGIDGDTANLTTFEITDTGDSTKASYFTPGSANQRWHHPLPTATCSTASRVALSVVHPSSLQSDPTRPVQPPRPRRAA